MTFVDLLHDPAAVVRADHAQLLPAAATAGAQVRAVADQLRGITGLERPRALVVAGADVAAEVALLTALVGSSGVSPVVGVREIPRWVGALDVVIVLADQADDPVAAAAADVAARRGASVFVRAVDAPGGVLLAPTVAVSEAFAGPARIALLVGVAGACGLMTVGDPERWADGLDAMALRCHPSTESFVNPASALAEHLTSGSALLIGLDPVGDALAGLFATVLVEVAGVPATALSRSAAQRSPALLRRAAQRRDLFADPDDSGGVDVRPAAVLMSGVPVDGAQLSRHPLVVALPAALLLEPATDAPGTPGSAVARGPNDREGRPNVAGPDGLPDPVSSAMSVLLQTTFVAVYLGLLSGQLPPLDHPDGLGRAGTGLGAVQPGGRWPASAPRSEREQFPDDPRDDLFRDR